jgi:translation initiation factor 3 subunit L
MAEEQRQRAQEESDLLLPDGVKTFVTTLFNHMLVPDDKALIEMQKCYENDWNKLTESYYRQSPWPSPGAISALVEDGE